MADEDQEMIQSLGHNSSGQLRSIVERVERLLEERRELQDDIKEVLAEAKGVGFSTKIIRKAIAWRAADKDKRQEEEALLDTYLAALGNL